jgi:hypothetical protein
MTSRQFFASLLTEDDHDSVPDLGRIGWFLLGALMVLGVALFFVIALLLTVAIVQGVDGASFGPLRDYAVAFGILFTGAGAAMGLCAGALAIKTRSGA